MSTNQEISFGSSVAGAAAAAAKPTQALVIAVDFDGTCVEHAYPGIGADIGATPTLLALTRAGHRLILWTVRSGALLAAAEGWFAERDIPLYGVNINPEQAGWSASPKAHANIFIDDLALGCSLVYPSGGRRPYVHWASVHAQLRLRGAL
jgi:hypothetical protein